MVSREMRSAGAMPKTKPTATAPARVKPTVAMSNRGSISNSPRA